MALNNASTLVVKTGRFYIAPVGTPAPSDNASILAPTTPWEELGHTSVEDILSWATEGGEATTLGSLQAPSLRTTTSPRVESFTTTLLQWDEESLPFYFGANMELIAGSTIFYGVSSTPDPIEKALLIVLRDGQNAFPIYAPSVSIARGDDLSIESTESLAGLPISITLQNYEGNAWSFAVAPVGTVTGTPVDPDPEP